jgi:hypothetical protein
MAGCHPANNRTEDGIWHDRGVRAEMFAYRFSFVFN